MFYYNNIIIVYIARYIILMVVIKYSDTSSLYDIVAINWYSLVSSPLPRAWKGVGHETIIDTHPQATMLCTQTIFSYIACQRMHSISFTMRRPLPTLISLLTRLSTGKSLPVCSEVLTCNCSWRSLPLGISLTRDS